MLIQQTVQVQAYQQLNKRKESPRDEQQQDESEHQQQGSEEDI